MIEVNASLLEEQTKRYNEGLCRPLGHSFKDAALRAGGHPIPTAVLFQSLQTALGGYGAAHRMLGKLDYQRDLEHRGPFSNAYAAHVGAHLGRAVVGAHASESAHVALDLPPAQLDRSELAFGLLLAGRKLGLLKDAQGSDHALALARGFYESLIEETGRGLRSQEFAGLLQQQGGAPFAITEPETRRRFVFCALDVREDAAKSDSLEDAVSLADIGGNDEAKRTFGYLLEFLREPEFMAAGGIRWPGGVLLYGPPGTGKTAMVKAFAKDAGLPFHMAKLSEILDPYFGVAERNLSNFLERNGVLFLDELDSLGRMRSYSDMPVNDRLVNVLATGLDKAAARQDAIAVAAANDLRPLDAKLLRPPRFGMHVLVDYPASAEEHAAISAIHLDRRLSRVSEQHMPQARAGLDYGAIAKALQVRSAELGASQVVRIAGAHIEHIVEQVFLETLLAGRPQGRMTFPSTADFVGYIKAYVPDRRDLAASEDAGRRMQWH